MAHTPGSKARKTSPAGDEPGPQGALLGTQQSLLDWGPPAPSHSQTELVTSEPHHRAPASEPHRLRGLGRHPADLLQLPFQGRSVSAQGCLWFSSFTVVISKEGSSPVASGERKHEGKPAPGGNPPPHHRGPHNRCSDWSEETSGACSLISKCKSEHS